MALKVPTYAVRILWPTARLMLLSLIFVELIFILLRSVYLIKMLVEKRLTGIGFGKILLLAVPDLTINALPWALLVGVLYIYLQLRESSELVVLQTSGMSPWQLAAPPLVLALVLAPVSASLAFFISPMAERTLKQILLYDAVENVGRLIVPGNFNAVGNAVIYADALEQDSTLLRGVLLHGRVQGGINSVATAQLGSIGHEGKKVSVRLAKGTLRSHLSEGIRFADETVLPTSRAVLDAQGNGEKTNADFQRKTVLRFGAYRMNFDPAELSGEGGILTIYERQLHELRPPFAVDDLFAQTHQTLLAARFVDRITRPVLVVVLALLAVALLIRWPFSREKTAVPGVLVLILGVVMEIAFLALNSYAASGELPTWLPFMPYAMVGGVSVLLLTLKTPSRPLLGGRRSAA